MTYVLTRQLSPELPAVAVEAKESEMPHVSRSESTAERHHVVAASGVPVVIDGASAAGSAPQNPESSVSASVSSHAHADVQEPPAASQGVVEQRRGARSSSSDTGAAMNAGMKANCQLPIIVIY